MKDRLWYCAPARHWEEALPLGNGRLGAMVFGGGATERIALNEETFWSGYPLDKNREGAGAHFRDARALALGGRLNEAQALIERNMLGGFTESYLPLGDLVIEQPGAEQSLVRQLRLDTAVSKTEYTIDGVRYRRSAFVSKPAEALFVRMEADRPSAIDLRVALSSKLHSTLTAAGNQMTLDVQAPSHVVPSYIDCERPILYDEAPEKKGMRARAIVKVMSVGGTVRVIGDTIHVIGADSVELRLFARTSFNGYGRHPFVDGVDEKALCEADLRAVERISWARAMDAHVRDHRHFYDRVDFSLGTRDFDDVPTDRRLIERDPEDQALLALLFHYGRYLLIASSRQGGEPANLQGIWSQDERAIWSGNYTININTQMNYWPAEVVNLPELAEPLFSLIEDLCHTGRPTARDHYGARGAVAHHNTDLWRLTNPVGEQYEGFAGCAFWPMSLGWLARHMLEHDRFHEDADFLRKRALPVYRLVTRFCLDACTPDDQGYLTIAPATSPENQFAYQGTICKVAKRATMTTAILREVFEGYLHILARLQMEEDMALEARSALTKLAPVDVGSRGQILEWEAEYEETEPQHRHISHLYSLYPGQGMTPAERQAAKQSLLLRGDDGTGWSIAWKAAAWARLLDGDHALKLIERQLMPVEAGSNMNLTHGGSYISLLCAHPPFQIDGNFGACAAMAEMLVQASGSDICLLPARPAQWKTGVVRGLRAPRGVLIDFAFEDGRVTQARIERQSAHALSITCNGQTIEIRPEDQLVTQLTSTASCSRVGAMRRRRGRTP